MANATMKNSLTLLVFALGLCGRADAVSIGLERAGTPGSAVSPGVFPDTAILARFYIYSPVTAAARRPVMETIGIVLNAWENAACTIPASMSVFQVSATSALAGWSAAAANSNSALGGLQFAAVNGHRFAELYGVQISGSGP
jgi:hypothetical protein